MQRANRIKKGDVVFVLTGREKGKTGKVLDIDHEKHRAIVEKLMVFKRHYKRGRNPAQPEGGIVEKNGSIHLSNLALIDPKTVQRIAELGDTALSLSPSAFAKLIADETEKWAKVIKTAGIKPQ